MWSEHTSPTFLVVVAASIVAHVALLAVLPPADAATPAPLPVTNVVTIDAVEPPAPPAPPPPVETPAAPERLAARAPMPRAPRPVARRPAAPPREVTTAEPPRAAETPVDFSGVTLSNEGSSWSSPTGNGEPMTGPIAVSDATARPGPVRTAPSGGSAADRVVAVGDLSRPPRAPDLDAALAANYPREARRAGITGKAVVRVRILRDGTVGPIRIVAESAPGFGVACKQTLAGSRWQAPLDAHDEPVATDVKYTCTFAVAR